MEFLGLPGSGKSTLSERVAAMLAKEGLPVRQTARDLAHGPRGGMRRIAKLVFVAREVARHPRYALRSARALRATGQRSRRVAFKMLFNWLLVSHLVRRSRRIPAVHLIDQGLHQALWSIGLEAGARSVAGMAGRLRGCAPSPDVTVVVAAGSQTVVRRLHRRAGRDSRADSWPGQDARALERAGALLDEVKALLPGGPERRPHPSVIDIDNDRDGDLEANARRLAEAIVLRVEATS